MPRRKPSRAAPEPISRALFGDAPHPGFQLVEPRLRAAAGSNQRKSAHSTPHEKAQQKFDRLVASIERKRQQLQQWQAYLPHYNQRVLNELAPLQEKFNASRWQMALLIDELLSQPAASERKHRLQPIHRRKLQHLLMQVIQALIADGREADTALETLHDKYSHTPLRELPSSAHDFRDAMLRDVSGDAFSGDSDSTDDGHELDAEFNEAIRTAQENEEHQANRRSERRSNKDGAYQSKREQAAAEAAAKAAAKVNQSLREIYRKLVSTLHPDREPDAALRQRKTVLMQRVNHAYEANDLLTLLTVQLEIEQIDAGHLASIPPARLAHYNQILREQLQALDDELEDCAAPLLASAGMRWHPGMKTALLDQHVSAACSELRVALKQLAQDRIVFRNPTTLRASLKDYSLDSDLDDDGELDTILQFLMEGSQPRRGRRRRR